MEIKVSEHSECQALRESPDGGTSVGAVLLIGLREEENRRIAILPHQMRSRDRWRCACR